MSKENADAALIKKIFIEDHEIQERKEKNSMTNRKIMENNKFKKTTT